MPFKYMLDFLRGGESRLDRIEERLRRIENSLSASGAYRRERPPRRRDVRKPDLRDVKVRRKRETDEYQRPQRIRRARTIYGPDGWCFEEEPWDMEERGEIEVRDFGRDWVIEFDCPSCGDTSVQGIEHRWTEHERDHTNYQVRIHCNRCGWESDDINIRAFK